MMDSWKIFQIIYLNLFIFEGEGVHSNTLTIAWGSTHKLCTYQLHHHGRAKQIIIFKDTYENEYNSLQQQNIRNSLIRS